MSVLRSLLCTALLKGLPALNISASAQHPSPGAPTLTVTSNLVFLDVTVLDKNGHPVVFHPGSDLRRSFPSDRSAMQPRRESSPD
jgi:hypothetical protein